MTVCLGVNTIGYQKGGGHFWAYLNWALGLRANGCRIIWLEMLSQRKPPERLESVLGSLRLWLNRYLPDADVALCTRAGTLMLDALDDCMSWEEAADESDVFITLNYGLPSEVVGQFSRRVLIDIDPGLFQIWLSESQLQVAQYDLYFTTGEAIGTSGSGIPSVGIEWHYTPPCVSTEVWKPVQASPEAPFRTVTQWWADEWVVHNSEQYRNDKRNGFLPFLMLPNMVAERLELALCLPSAELDERRMLTSHGWLLQDAELVAGTPWDYQSYIQGAKGEFSCAKPSCVKLQNSWVSDRTLCFLASGKPAVVQYTGPSRYLPDAEGIFRFRDIAEARQHLAIVAADYGHQCRRARELAKQHFDAKQVARSLLEKCV